MKMNTDGRPMTDLDRYNHGATQYGFGYGGVYTRPTTETKKDMPEHVAQRLKDGRLRHDAMRIRELYERIRHNERLQSDGVPPWRYNELAADINRCWEKIADMIRPNHTTI